MISCEQHDYVEIACTFRYPIRLTMRSGEVIQAVALDTLLDKNRAECIKVRIDETECLVVSDDVLEMEVLTENPHFQTVTFT